MDSLPAALKICVPISIRWSDFSTSLRVAQNGFRPTDFSEALND